MSNLVRDHIPLEQGLRHTTSSIPVLRQSVRDHIPLEQGLRQDQRNNYQ